MVRIRKLKIAALAGVSFAGVMISPAFAAGRCGGSLAIDAATTLAEVARRCNVNLSALYEANPGVDPRNVTSGTYLAMPDEIDQFANNGASSVSLGDGSKEVVASTDHTQEFRDDRGLGDWRADDVSRVYDARLSTRARVHDLRRSSSDPVWIRETTGGGQRSSAADRLSYQQRSALRIHNAGVPVIPRGEISPGLRNNVSAPSGELISCSVLRQHSDGELRKVRKIISTPTNTFVEVEPIAGGGFDCTLTSANASLTDGVPAAHYGLPEGSLGAPLPLRKDRDYRLPDYGKINPAKDTLTTKISLSGQVVDEENGCLVLRTENGRRWALAAAPGAQSLIGKHLTAWGVSSRSGVCGAAPTMLVSHAVYAEPWSGK